MRRWLTARVDVPVSRRARLLQLAVTTALVLGALLCAATNAWAPALACLLTGTAIAGVSHQMESRGGGRRRPRYEGRVDARD